MNIAIILSAGIGSRFGSNIPKQFINLAGKNIIEYTIAAFEQNENIDEICIVADLIYHDKLSQISKENNFKKVNRIIQGGTERKDSSYNAIKEYKDLKNINLIFHDAVRPFVSQEIINNTIKALENYSAVDVAIPTADTIIQIDTDLKIIEKIPQRSKLQRGQTPQGFKLEIIKKAHELSNEDTNEPMFTDDCGLVKQYLTDEKIFVVSGEEKNIKITYPEDLLFAEKLIQINTITIPKREYFGKLKDKVIIVFGGHSGIGKEICLLGRKHGANIYPVSLRDGIDITVKEDIEKILSKVYLKYRKIDCIINCAAIFTKNNIIDINETDIEKEIFTNYIACVKMAKSVYPYLRESKGHFILFSSSSYTKGRAGYSLYSSTKAAIVNFTEGLSQEWLRDNIKVNVVNPARTDTPMRRANFRDEDINSLLTPLIVAEATISILMKEFTGLVIDVKQGIQTY